jgi:hypothetical protein
VCDCAPSKRAEMMMVLTVVERGPATVARGRAGGGLKPTEGSDNCMPTAAVQRRSLPSQLPTLCAVCGCYTACGSTARYTTILVLRTRSEHQYDRGGL